MNEQKQEQEVLNDAQQEAPEQQEFVSSPKWKRVLAWTLFGVMVLGIFCWLLNIAVPEWPEKLFGYFGH